MSTAPAEVVADQTITLPPIREARTWNTTTDALLAALEREEREAVSAYESAKERAQQARRAVAMLRRIRGVVTVGGTGGCPSAPKIPAPPGSVPLALTAPALTAASERRWARDYDRCTSCGRTEVRHAARGLCFSCYSKASKSLQETAP